MPNNRFNPVPFFYQIGGIGAKQLKLNQKEYRKVFLDEYEKIEHIKFIPFFMYMVVRRKIKELLL